MGKITQALKNVSLPPETKLVIEALDKEFSNLESHVEDVRAVVEKYGAHKEPAPKRPPPQPYDAKQGTGTAPPKVILGRKPRTGGR